MPIKRAQPVQFGSWSCLTQERSAKAVPALPSAASPNMCARRNRRRACATAVREQVHRPKLAGSLGRPRRNAAHPFRDRDNRSSSSGTCCGTGPRKTT